MQKVRIENYKCGVTTVLSGVKENVLKILGRKCTQMLILIILCWQNYGQFLFFYPIFIFYIFYHSYYVFIKRKKSHWRRGKKKKRHILRVSHPRHSATPLKLTGIYWGPTKGPAPPQPLQKESSGPSRTLKAHIDHIYIFFVWQISWDHTISLLKLERRLFA